MTWAAGCALRSLCPDAVPTSKAVVQEEMSFRTGMFAAWGGAFFFEVAGVASVLLYLRPRPSISSASAPALGQLDPAYLKALWAWNRENFPWFLLIDACICFAMLLLVHVAMCLKKCFPRGQGMGRTLMANAFIIGAIIPTVEFLQDLGSTSAADWISSNDPPLGDNAWISLQISWLLAVSRSLYLYAMLYVFLAFGFGFFGWLTLKDRPFQGAQGLAKLVAVLGLAVAFLGIIVLGLEVSVFFDTSLAVPFGIFVMFWAMIGMPIWLLGAGALLSRATSVAMHLSQREEQEMQARLPSAMVGQEAEAPK